jgi:hypothetical protein
MDDFDWLKTLLATTMQRKSSTNVQYNITSTIKLSRIVQCFYQFGLSYSSAKAQITGMAERPKMRLRVVSIFQLIFTMLVLLSAVYTTVSAGMKYSEMKGVHLRISATQV